LRVYQHNASTAFKQFSTEQTLAIELND